MCLVNLQSAQLAKKQRRAGFKTSTLKLINIVDKHLR